MVRRSPRTWMVRRSPRWRPSRPTCPTSRLTYPSRLTCYPSRLNNPSRLTHPSPPPTRRHAGAGSPGCSSSCEVPSPSPPYRTRLLPPRIPLPWKSRFPGRAGCPRRAGCRGTAGRSGTAGGRRAAGARRRARHRSHRALARDHRRRARSHRSHRRRARSSPRQPWPGASPAVLARLGAGARRASTVRFSPRSSLEGLRAPRSRLRSLCRRRWGRCWRRRHPATDPAAWHTTRCRRPLPSRFRSRSSRRR